MKTFEELRARLSQDLLELKKLEAGGLFKRLERSVKEQQIGQRCYEAEEDLDTPELTQLKQILQIPENKWRNYKAKFIGGSSPGESV